MILRAIASFIFIFFASQANAQTCPDFYRFIDFGTKANDGIIYRGGLVLRAEGFDGKDLLLTEHTKCISVPEVAKDGHGNPIPVVSSINYKPEVASLDVKELRVSSSDDTKTLAIENAKTHQMRVNQSDTKSTRGSNFLCANTNSQKELSCQMVSPYPGNIALVIYCDIQKCTMPVLAINEKILVSASWKFNENLLKNPEAASNEISNQVQQIHDFLKPLSADL